MRCPLHLPHTAAWALQAWVGAVQAGFGSAVAAAAAVGACSHHAAAVAASGGKVAAAAAAVSSAAVAACAAVVQGPVHHPALRTQSLSVAVAVGMAAADHPCPASAVAAAGADPAGYNPACLAGRRASLAAVTADCRLATASCP